MSKYSSRCDVYDSLADVTDFSKIKIFAYDNDIVPLRIDSQKDLMPYYPYIVAIQNGDGDGNTTVYLSKESYVDEEEKERLSWYLKDIKKYWNRCRHRTEFDDEEAANLIRHFDEELPDYKKEIIKRVKEQGNKATIENIHIPLYDDMRSQLYNDMVDAGWNKWTAYRWVYGWHRWATAMNAQKFGDMTYQMTLDIDEVDT